MKPILVADCNNYSFDTNNCTKCGRSMPDTCVEYEDMKRKAEAYDKLDRDTSDTSVPDKRSDGSPLPRDSINAAYEEADRELTIDPYVTKAATRKGRPPKAKL